MIEGTTPSREEILACYRPIRASIQAVLAEAVKQCKKPDLDRAAKHLDLIDPEQLDDDSTFAMLCDVALFEPNQRGRRVIDSFLDKRLGALLLADRHVARKLAAAFFSIFRVADWHEAGGVWLDDLLKPGRRLWLMDEGLEASASEGLVIAMRVFDAGPFYAGFGIIVQPDAEAVTLCIKAVSHGQPLPVRHSLAAALYGDAIAEVSPIPISSADVMAVLATMTDAAALPSPKPKRARPKRRI
ncbi:hypothetical protein ACLBXO_30245 [Methylobacterium sp. C33D]